MLHRPSSERGITTGEPVAVVRRSWAQVHEQALRAAGALVEAGIGPGDAVAVLAADPALIAPSVRAVWLAGGSVTMLHQPTARTDLEAWAGDTVRVLEMIGASLVLLGPPFDVLADVLAGHGIAYLPLTRLLEQPDAAAGLPEMGEDDTALLQLTSGSTAAPKAVRITHRNLVANMDSMRRAAALDPEHDVMVSWLPLFHDMGMVGLLTTPMTLGIELVTVTPADFLARPLLWPELISRYGGTVTAAPNFAYAVAGRRLSTVDDEHAYDLSSMRFALNGAEPIDPAAVEAFTDAGARFGLKSTAMVCAYGMAESTLGVAFAPRDRGLRVDVVDGERLATERRAVPVGAGVAGARTLPLLGPPLPGLELKVTADDGTVLGAREVGLLWLRGDAVTPGYLTEDGPRAAQDAEGWLDTGDEGYLTEDGEVVVCGRRKDMIIMGGRNVYPTDVERAAERVAGVRAGNAAAVRLAAGTLRPRETFAVVVESRQAQDEAAARTIREEVAGQVLDAVGARPIRVLVVPPGTLPKTPSGKLRRGAAADLVLGTDRTGAER
jgi:fatty-acyl-CoA synthase